MMEEESLGSSELGSSPGALPGLRQVTDVDADRVAELFALAFYDDPTWSWAFPDPDQRKDQHRSLWTLFLHGALPHGWVWMTDDGAAASLWIPPGEPELSDSDEARLKPLVRELVGARGRGAGAVRALRCQPSPARAALLLGSLPTSAGSVRPRVRWIDHHGERNGDEPALAAPPGLGGLGIWLLV
jgi:hypothetical protein